jgi:glycosyl transferase family 2
VSIARIRVATSAAARAASRLRATAGQQEPNMTASGRERALGERLSVAADPAAMTESRLTGLSIVLPCHDEEANVAQAVREATRAAASAAERHEILVVDDGSADGTRRLAAALAADDPRVRVLVHERNRGYGAALRTGIAAARCDWILLTDADLQFDLGELDRLLAPAMRHDLVVGFRLARMDPFPRRVNAYAWNQLVGRVFDLDVRDVDCAFKLVRRDLAQRLRLTADGAMISTELVARAALAGASIAELGVHHRPRQAGRQSGADPAVVLTAFRELRRIRSELGADAAAGRRVAAADGGRSGAPDGPRPAAA